MTSRVEEAQVTARAMVTLAASAEDWRETIPEMIRVLYPGEIPDEVTSGDEVAIVLALMMSTMIGALASLTGVTEADVLDVVIRATS